jgi:hypothetical protein
LPFHPEIAGTLESAAKFMKKRIVPLSAQRQVARPGEPAESWFAGWEIALLPLPLQPMNMAHYP